jgi:hypothetical protein
MQLAPIEVRFCNQHMAFVESLLKRAGANAIGCLEGKQQFVAVNRVK